MKNYDLSQYMLRDGNVLMFPLTKEEVELLTNDTQKFSEYIRLPYITAPIATKTLTEIGNEIDMENDYWFMSSLWAVVDIKAKEIYGTIRYKKDGDINKIIKNITLLLDAQETYQQAINLFAKFLAVNNYNNIIIEDEEYYEG